MVGIYGLADAQTTNLPAILSCIQSEYGAPNNADFRIFLSLYHKIDFLTGCQKICISEIRKIFWYRNSLFMISEYGLRLSENLNDILTSKNEFW